MSVQRFDAELLEVSERAEGVRERYAMEPPTEDDFADFEGEGYRLRMFLGEVREVLAPLHVAGIAFPDADLPDELDSLAEKAEAFGLATGVEHLARLSRSLRALLAARGRRARKPWLEQSWGEMQRLVTWTRMMRTECDLLQIEGSLVASYEGRVQRATREVQSLATMDVWPFGVTVARDGQALIYGSDVESGKPVLLKDTFAEMSALDPMRAPTISRLMQGAVSLHKVLRGLIRLTEHPYQRMGRCWVFSPGFKTIARPISRSSSVKAPALSELTVTSGKGIAWVDGGEPGTTDIGWLYLELVMTEAGVELRSTEGHEVPITMTEALALNLTKLLLRDGEDRVQVRFVCLVQERLLYALNATTAMDGRVFPSLDTLLFRRPREVFTAAMSPICARAPWELLRLALAAELGRYGALTDERMSATREQLMRFEARGVDRVWLHTLACLRSGASLNMERIARLVTDALRVAASPADADPGTLERVLGRASGEPDRWGLLLAFGEGHAEQEGVEEAPAISNARLVRVLWLSCLFGFDEERRRLGLAILADRFSGPLQRPGIAEICARALLMRVAADPEEDLDEPLDDDDERVVGVRAAQEFLEAHVGDIQPDGRRTSMPDGAPLDLFELLLISQACDLVEFRSPGAAFALPLAPIPLAHRCASVLARVGAAANNLDNTASHMDLLASLLVLDTAGLAALLVE